MEDDWEADLADYSLGVMDPAAASEFEQRLSRCREQVVLAQQYSEVAGLLGFVAAPAEPAQGHKERFLARLGATPQEPALSPAEAAPTLLVPGTDSTSRVPPYAGDPARGRVSDLAAYRERRSSRGALAAFAAVAAALVLIVGGWGWTQYQRAAEMEGVMAQARTALMIPASSVPFPVTGQAEQPNAWAVGFMDPQTNEMVLLAKNLQPLTGARVYEAWWLRKDGGDPMPAGVFTPDATGKAKHTVKAPGRLEDFSGIAVTLERGEVPKAEGPVVLVGEYKFD